MNRFDATILCLVDLWTAAGRARPQPHKANNNRSGQLMCYKNRTSLSATDSQTVLGICISLNYRAS